MARGDGGTRGSDAIANQRTSGAWQAARSGSATRGTEVKRCVGKGGGMTSVKLEATTNQRTREAQKEAGAMRGRGPSRLEATVQ